MVQIKRTFHILIIIALLINFSSCGIKWSGNFQEVDFKKTLPVQIMYRQNLYDCFVFFDGQKLEVSLTMDNEEKITFVTDSMTTTVTFRELSKTYENSILPVDFFPVIIYDFFTQTGSVVKTELYNKEENVSSVKRNVNNNFVELEVFLGQEQIAYSITIT